MNIEALEALLRRVNDARERAGIGTWSQDGRMLFDDSDADYHKAREELSEALLANADELIRGAKELASLHLRLAETDARLAHVEACIAEVLSGLED